MMPKGSINSWYCPDCKGTLTAIHKHDGTTPMFLKCRVTTDCEGWMESAGYPSKLQNPSDTDLYNIEWVWYCPEQDEYDELEDWAKEHVDWGGLLLKGVSYA